MPSSVLYMSMSLDGFITGRTTTPTRALEPEASACMNGLGSRAAATLFEHLGDTHIELELTRVLDAPGVTHLRYRVAS